MRAKKHGERFIRQHSGHRNRSGRHAARFKAAGESAHNSGDPKDACGRQKIVVATARPPRSVKAVLPEELLVICSFIYYNGAMVTDETGSVIHEAFMPRELSSAILDFVSERAGDASVSLEVSDVWYSVKAGAPEWTVGRTFGALTEPRSLDELKGMSPAKILISGGPVCSDLMAAFGDKANILLTDAGRLIQIMPEGVSKESGLAYWSAASRIPTDAVLVFGDDVNDLGMFRLCGYSAAMGNAIPELKEIAGEIADTHDRDGVAKVLERLLAERVPPTRNDRTPQRD